MTRIHWLQGKPIRMRLQYIGGGEKALEAFRVQNRPALIFAGLLVHVSSVLRVYYDQLIKHRDPTIRNRVWLDPKLYEQPRKTCVAARQLAMPILGFQAKPAGSTTSNCAASRVRMTI